MADRPSLMVTRFSLVSLQVCVPTQASDPEVEAFANEAHPTGIESKWRIRRQGDPSLSGCDERVPCQQRGGCVHVMLDC